ncbi:MAG: COQ9 family protein [Rhodobacteraceae bacterium]|nr:COQ9 family protein [Paracoccaceae bacterium]
MDRDKLLDAALVHVPFDGWTEATFRAAVADSGADPVVARGVFPRGALDLALAYHRRGDDLMSERLADVDLGAMKIREKITFAVRARLEVIEDRELVRRGLTLFSLPMHAADGARALWGTADLIWTAIGDSSEDVNWYTKRATLSGVYSSVVLYWLGDDTPGNEATWAFLDRRIEDVMRIEKVKARIRTNALLKPLMAGPTWLAARIKAPKPAGNDLPGRWRR